MRRDCDEPLAQVPIALLAYEPERAWFNGRIAASQAADVGSIPIARSRNSLRANFFAQEVSYQANSTAGLFTQRRADWYFSRIARA